MRVNATKAKNNNETIYARKNNELTNLASDWSAECINNEFYITVDSDIH